MRRNHFKRRHGALNAAAARRRARRRFVAIRLERLEDRLAPALGAFELDGNARTQTTHDWDQVYNDAVLNPGQNTSGSIPGAVFFIHDPVNSPLDDGFTGGSSVDFNDVSQWQWKPGTPQGKADIADAFAAAYKVQVGTETHTIINFGADRYDNVGNTTVGMWFFQNPISKNPNGTFSGAHTVGDILIVAESSSGATINVYRWIGPGGSTSSLQLLTTNASNVIATVNAANIPSGGWPFTDKGGTIPANTIAKEEFFEGGIDLTALGLPSDLSTFVLETRTSSSLSSPLSDFVIGRFDTSPSDLAVTKAASNPTPNVGDTITFTVSLANNGPGTANNIVLSDVLPAGLSFVSAAPTQGTYNPATALWNVGTLHSGADATLALRAQVDTPDAQTNTATIQVSSSNDPNPANNTASATVTPQQADLAVTKTVSDATPNVGDQITFTVTLTNAGPSAATGVRLEDLLPTGLAFVSATTSQGSYLPGTGVWIVGTVAPDTPRTLTIDATVVTPLARTNTAAITNADQFDPNTGNNTASVIETPQQADLALTKSVSDRAPNVGEQITFTVTLTNSGPDDASDVQVSDLLPAGLTFVAATPSQGAYTAGTGVWNVGAVSDGAGATLAIVATVVSPDARTNTATIADSDQFDPHTGNNSASATETPQQADLFIIKSVSDPTPNVDDTISFTLDIANGGPDTATNIIVTDLLPAGVTFVSAAASQGAYDNLAGVWTVGTVAPAATPTLTIIVIVNSTGAIVNTATIDGDQFDPNLANNTASTSADPQAADLVIIKSVSDPKPHKGDIITYTLGVANAGPATATGVTVADLLPSGVTFVMSTATQGAYDNVAGIWTVGSVAPAATATLTIAVTVDQTNTILNTATVDGDQFDPNTGNNTDSSPVKAVEADLLLLKDVSDSTPNVGDQITFTVALVNSGPDTAEGVEVTDLLPTGLTFVSADPSQGTYDNVTGLWDVGTMTPGPAQTLAIVATVISATAQTNTATITDGDRDDPNFGNNSASATETPQQTDLAVTKTVSDRAPNVGDVITFTVTVTNQGPSTATNVQITDVLPPGLTPVLTRVRRGTFASQVWDVGTLAAGASSTLTIIVRVDSPDAQTNTATVTNADQFDANTANNSASATETPQQADLALTKLVSDATPNVGDQIAFTVTLTNSGPDAATNVEVDDLLPAELAFVSAIASQGTYDSVPGLWTVGTVNPGSPVTFTILATVVSPDPQTNTATVGSADQFDPNTANNTASATETPQQADLALTKTVSDATPNVGDQITFTVTLTNNGPDDASGVRVADLLPPGLTFVSANPSQGVYLPGSGVWTVGAVTAGVPQSLVLTVRVDSPDAQTNTATISDSDQFDANTANNSGSATETPQQADLAVGKMVSDPTPNVGDLITYSITVSNAGPNAASGVTLQDTLPAGLTFQSSTASQGSYDQGTGVWTVGTVAASAIQTLTIAALVTTPGVQANTASVADADQFDPNLGNNTDTAEIDPQQADLAVTKSVSDPTPNVGDTITFTVNLSNNGPTDATGVQVTDLLPAGVTFVSATPSQGTYTPGSGVWDVGTVTAGTPQTLAILVTVVSAAAQTNTGTISDSDQFDPNTGNNTASATETPQRADLSVTKTVSDPTPNVGDNITFTVTLTNQGPDAATGVQVTDLLPAGLTFVSATPSQGTYNSTTGVWDVGTVAAGTQTLQIVATVVSSGSRTNTATVTDADQFDPDPGDNSGGATETPQQADLVVAKIVSDATPNVGDVIAFTITLTNSGPDAATGVTIQDALPAGLSFVSATASAGTHDNASGVWTVGTLASGAGATLTIQAQVQSPDESTNTAAVADVDQFDPDLADNSASATETPQQADLAVSKLVSDATPNVGDTITFTISVTNSGPDAATNVTLTDLLPAGLTFIDATPSQGNYASAVGVWIVGTVVPGAPETLSIQARVDSPGARTNTATVSAADQFDPNTANNSGSATETPQRAELAITKTVSDATPNVGDDITFTVTLTNQGIDVATGVVVNDLLPAGLTFVTAIPSQGTYSDATGVWTVGAVSTLAPATLTITATVVSPDARTNTATVSAADQFDPITANNSGSATENPQRADLALTKSVSDSTPNVGDQITFTITLTSAGADVATGVQVTDLLPAGVIFVSANPSQGTYDDASGVWDVGTVAPGTPQTLTITATVLSPDAQTNTATISDADQFDPNTADNSGSATETPQQSDLALAKTVSDATPNVGEQITFTIILSNSGPDTATGIVITDLLPAGLTFVSATTSRGTYNDATGTWTVASVSTAAPQTLQIVATVVSPLAQTNTATVTGSDQFDPDPGDNAASVTETPQQAASSLSGSVYVDRNNSGARNQGEVGIPGVTVVLTGTDVAGNAVNATVVTDASGNYRFTRMLAGTYTLTEVHPAEFLDGLDRAGNAGGQAANDVITGIVLGANQNGTGYLFGERGLAVVSKPPFLMPNPGTGRPPGSGVTEVNPLPPPPPVGSLLAAFQWLPTAAAAIQFEDRSASGSARVVGWSWDFGDDTEPSSLSNPEHQFPAAGTYVVTLRITDELGRTSVVTHQVTVGIGVQDGVLLIPGTDGDDRITVSRVGRFVRVQSLLATPLVRNFPAGGIRSIVAFGFGGNDTITISPAIRAAAEIHGDEGNDVIRGGGGNDRVSGGDGDDTIYGGGGHDDLAGGMGQDQLFGLAGRDRLYGDLGDDRLDGGADNDVLVGDDGNDSLSGLAGSDLLIGGAGADTLARSKASVLAIAGSTAFDLDPAALSSLLAEWSNPRHSRAARIASLQGANPPANRRNGNLFLVDVGAQATVFTDGDVDSLDVLSGRDWWLADLAQDLVSITTPRKRR